MYAKSPSPRNLVIAGGVFALGVFGSVAGDVDDCTGSSVPRESRVRSSVFVPPFSSGLWKDPVVEARSIGVVVGLDTCEVISSICNWC